MADGLNMLEKRINEFNQALADMKEATSEAHSVLKQIQLERKAIERLLGTEIKNRVNEEIAEVVKNELEKIGPTLRDESSKIYTKVGREVDRLIDICMGKFFAVEHNRKDLRPQLAEKLREWIREIIVEETEFIKGE